MLVYASAVAVTLSSGVGESQDMFIMKESFFVVKSGSKESLVRRVYLVLSIVVIFSG